MSSLKLNTSKDLAKFKDAINVVLESRIESAKLSEALRNLKEQPFGTINSIFENVSDKLFESKKGKAVIAKYVSALKENKDVRNAYFVLEGVNNPKYVTNVSLLVNEVLAHAENINKKSFNEGKAKIAGIVAEAASIAKLNSNELAAIINENTEVNTIIESFITKNKMNLFERANLLDTLSKHIAERVPEKPINESASVKSLASDLHSLMENGRKDLEPWESQAIQSIVMTNLSNGDKKALFESYKEKCINAIDNILDEGNSVEEKSRLSQMKEQLSRKEYSESSICEDILNLSKLAHTLAE